MKFSGVTIEVQRKYSLHKSFLTSSCEYEEWDTPEKLCYLLFESTPLIGEMRLSSEQYGKFSERGQQLFAKLMLGSEQSLSLLEKQMLAAAVVFHVQKADDNTTSDDDNGDGCPAFQGRNRRQEGSCGVLTGGDGYVRLPKGCDL